MGESCSNSAMFSATNLRYYLIVCHSFPPVLGLHVVFLLKAPFVD